MSQPRPLTPDADRPHEEVFLARYGLLRAWALRLAGNDRERAEDLVQDAFVHFTLARPDLARIGNLEGYLYRVLRNLNVSDLRRRERLHSRGLSVVEYDSAEVGLRAADPRDALRVQEELRACCRYACARKDSSKMGSVLILRFLHGYYPREIALVMKGTRAAVEERLRGARAEARQYLKDPSSLRFMGRGKAWEGPPAQAGPALTTDELLRDLREAVFRSCRGECLGAALLERLYGEGGGEPLETATLAHAVSCPRCLDEINRRLGLAPLGERYPTDTLEKEARRRGGGDDDDGAGGDMTGTGSGAEEFFRRGRRRARAAFEHRPLELGISVDGRLVAAQKVGGAFNEQSLSLREGEGVDFIEVVSEQEVRLLFLDLSARAEGERLCLARVGLSDERMLEASVSFEGPAPVVQVVYHDPLLAAEAPAEAPQGAASPAAFEGDAATNSGAGGTRLGVLHAAGAVLASLLGRGFWLRPGPLTAGLAVLVIAALLFVRLNVPAASAAELVRRSVAREQAAASDPNLVLHRVLHVEERQAGRGPVISRRRVEAWQSAAWGVHARRVYDEQNNLVAGVWTDASGSLTVYRAGAPGQGYGPRGVPAAEALAAGDAWLIDLSAKEFSGLVGDPGRLSVEESSDSYVLDFQNASAAEGLLRATLELNRTNLRAVGQTLIARVPAGEREYHFTENAYERLPAGRFGPDIFRPDPVFGAPAPAPTAPRGADDSGPARPPAPDGEGSERRQAAASPELEVEVTYLLSQIRADLGEQVSMTRTAGGALRVVALVETPGRKQEVLRALRPVSNHPAVLIEVSTVEEAVRARRAQGGGPGSTREVEVESGRVPADAELRRHFAARLVGEQRIDEAIRQFSRRAMNRSRQALLHASALQRLAGRFSPAEVGALTPEARGKWLSMIAGHAAAYRREVESLRRELGAVFAAGGGGGGGEAVGEANLSQAAGRLAQLSRAHDEAVRSAFALSAEGGTAAHVRSAQFWRSLRTAEGLAAAVERAARR